MTTVVDIPVVYIPAAGLGSRVREFGVSKPLISLGQRPVICELILSYPKGTEFLVALGHQGGYLHQVLEVFAEVYGLAIDFVWTDSHLPSEETGLGLSKTLLDSRHKLQRPFIFHSVDTLIDGQSWLHAISQSKGVVLVSQPDKPGHYRCISGDRLVRSAPTEGLAVYLGVSRIQDYREFWHDFEQNISGSDPEEGEALGIRISEYSVLEIPRGQWHDMGNAEQLKSAILQAVNSDHVLVKPDEAIWLFGDKMVKFHESPGFISGRLERSFALSGFVPPCQSPSPNLLTYQRAVGNVLSSCDDPRCFEEFLDFCLVFWDIEGEHDYQNHDYFGFYKTKTHERISSYLARYPADARLRSINTLHTRNLSDLLEGIDWQELSLPRLVRAHGDLHSENVIHNHDFQRFVLIDWRQSMAGSFGKSGDLYYDLAKILHGLIVDHRSIASGLFEVRDLSPTSSDIHLTVPKNKLEWLSLFERFIEHNDFDRKKVWLITGLIFLNIAPLHHEGYDRFLYRIGLLILSQHSNPNVLKCVLEAVARES